MIKPVGLKKKMNVWMNEKAADNMFENANIIKIV